MSYNRTELVFQLQESAKHHNCKECRDVLAQAAEMLKIQNDPEAVRHVIETLRTKAKIMSDHGLRTDGRSYLDALKLVEEVLIVGM